MTTGSERLHNEEIVQAGAEAFGGFGFDQATHIFAREAHPPEAPTVTALAPRTYAIRLGLVNAALFETGDGLVLVDCGCAGDGEALRDAVRECSDAPLHTVVLTHGHLDHAFGLWALLADGEAPRVVAHENILGHYARYAATAGLNAEINFQRPGDNGKAWPRDPGDFLWPDTTFRDTLELRVAGERFVLRHARGETDDATWVWAPERAAIATGDLVVGYLPNCGNPRKVQRYAHEWAEAAEEMAGLAPELLLTGHGEPVRGREAIHDELYALAEVLRHIERHAIDGLNAGMLPDDIVESLQIPARLAQHPRLQPLYDRPEFICRNVIRRYGGWWDRYPGNLLPAPMGDRAREIAALAGGTDALVRRARELADTDLRLACHLAEWAFLADRHDERAQECYVELFARRASGEPGLMAKMAFAQPRMDVAAVRGPSAG